jgi:hypothetical protein
MEKEAKMPKFLIFGRYTQFQGQKLTFIGSSHLGPYDLKIW